MRFTKFGIYRHRRCQEVDIVIIKNQYQGLSYTKLRVMYIRQGDSNVTFGQDNIIINKSEYENWNYIGIV